MSEEYSPLGVALVAALREIKLEDRTWSPTSREWQVLQLRAEGKTQAQVGRILGVTGGRIGQIERQIEVKLRRKYAP